MTVSAATISRAEDAALDRSVPKEGSGLAGLSVRNGPVTDDMAVDSPATNGHANKRKSRSSITRPVYKDESDSDASQPLVGFKHISEARKFCTLVTFC
jgi:DNA topoisomerase-1